MKILIKKLLREHIEDKYNQLLKDAVVFFPKIKMKDWPTKKGIETVYFKDGNTNQKFINYDELRNQIFMLKMKNIRKWVQQSFDPNVVFAKTGSIYFNYNDINYRISNHPSNKFNGVSFDIDERENINDIKRKIYSQIKKG